MQKPRQWSHTPTVEMNDIEPEGDMSDHIKKVTAKMATKAWFTNRQTPVSRDAQAVTQAATPKKRERSQSNHFPSEPSCQHFATAPSRDVLGNSRASSSPRPSRAGAALKRN